MSMSDPAHVPHQVEFTCWNCKTAQSVNIREVQKDRLDADYLEITPQPENPQRYHIRCPACAKFNTVNF
jgi:hypothetical protein